MNEAKFKIGDRVRIVRKKDTSAVVRDVYVGDSECVYRIATDNHLVFYIVEDELELVPEKNYSMAVQIDVAENVVIATLYEETEIVKSPLAKGHGHIIHAGELGIAQAASYACKKLYESLGGEITKGGSWR